MALQQLGSIFDDMPGVELRALFLDVVRSIPECRMTALDFLEEARNDLSLRRTVSVDNLVDMNSGYAVSTPCLSKVRGMRHKIRCGGHLFVLHNYRKPSVCSFTNKPLEGFIRQGYNCVNCLLDVHPKEVKRVPRCLGLKSMKARKVEKKRARKHRPKKSTALQPRMLKLGSVLMTSSDADTRSHGNGEQEQAPDDDNDDENAEVIKLIVPMTPHGGIEGEADTDSRLSGVGLVDAGPTEPIASIAAALEAEDTTTNGHHSHPPLEEDDAPPQHETHRRETLIAPNGVDDHDGRHHTDDDEGGARKEEEGVDDAPSEKAHEEEDSESEYCEENSSDEDVSSDEGEFQQVIERNHSSPSKSARADESDDDVLAVPSTGDSLHPPERRRLRTGAKADWTRHGTSFKVRMNASRRLNVDTMQAFLDDPTALSEEFDTMPQNRVNIVTMPKLTEGCNRYMNILPNNHTRVVLSQIGDDETSTYINANWMDGYGNKKDEFIACQGPLASTVHAFWRMVWETGAHVIVMNTGLVEKGVDKCERYWPECGEDGTGTLVVKDFTIKLVRTVSDVPEFVESKLLVTRAGAEEEEGGEASSPRSMTHLWWTEWPDKGVPKTANGIGDYILRTRAAAQEHGGPIVIHCSAGIGRTGCFLSINYCMQQFDHGGHVDIVNCVCRLRQMRGMTVQTESQYRWIHRVMLRYMQGKLFDRETDVDDETAPENPPETTQDDISKLTVRKSKDRPLSFQLGRKASSRAARRMVERKKSNEELKPEPVHAGPATSDVVLSESRIERQSNILIAGASYTKGECIFNVRTFVRPTTCVICESMLTGLALQGLRCSGCKRNICAVCLSTLDDTTKCIKRSNVKRQKSGLPAWPPQRPASIMVGNVYGSRLENVPEIP
eukprot:m.125963 g.125963  ORF g.125963 m.125963 type:complete len:895 (+) comp11179_c0_seq2:88-2772(+)